MFKHLFTLFALCIYFSSAVAQTINPEKLEQEISKLNDEHKYDTSIVILSKIIENPKASHYDKYNAYLQKYLTYKRVFNYASSANNLELASEHGLKTKHTTEVETRILIEKLFLNFDLQRDDEVDKIIPQINEKNLHLLSKENQAFYASVLAILATRKKKYDEAERRLNQAISILEKDYPKHLPNIYRKKIALYQETKKHNKVLEAYNKGVYYAEKYGIDIYRIVMEEAIINYYVSVNNYKSALLAQKDVIKRRTKYDASNVSSNLTFLEKKMQQEQNKLEIDYEKKIRIFLILVTLLLAIIIGILFKLFKVTEQKHLLAEKDIIRMRNELQKVTEEINEKGENELNLNSYNLSQRQIEIIELIKQGKTNKEIGNALFISENTVKYHLKAIYGLLGIDSRLELKPQYA